MNLSDWVLAILPMSFVGARKIAAMERLLDEMERKQAEQEKVDRELIERIERAYRARVSARRHERIAE